MAGGLAGGLAAELAAELARGLAARGGVGAEVGWPGWRWRSLRRHGKAKAKAGAIMMFEVMAERCDQCLYGPDKIVSNTRRREILRGIENEDDYFICHKATIAGRKCACRGDWDQRSCGQLGRIAGRIGAVTFVPENDLGK